ncbi:MAG: ATP-binding protein [Bacteroidales bacterium]|jgi:signal transduction histidine kinase/ligand-binding sensor domain-containing protein/CheY-like chemotaxis protein|nr:ATP-binding protein [Bacteroidales bacterium]
MNEGILKRSICIIIFLIITGFAYSQNYDYKFEKLSIKDGLSHSNVYTIIQDQSGYMWFGTQDGLDKYDGYEFTIYRHEPTNPNSLSSANFGKILQDSSGIFWFGTFSSGLDRFDPKTNTFKNFSNNPDDPNSLSNNLILFVFEDSNNEIWLGTSDGGLNKFNKKDQNFTRFQPNLNDPFSFSSLRAKCMCETIDKTLWIGSGNGLNKYNKNNNNFTLYTHNPNNKNSLSSNSIQHLYADENGIIWIAYRESGISKFDPKTETFTHFKHNPNDPSSISENNAEFIYKDSYGYFWIGTYQSGLNKYDPKTDKFTHFVHDPNNIESISHNRIEYMYEDASRNLWIATRGGGINKLDLKPHNFKNIIHNPEDNNTLPHPSVMAIDIDKSKNIWIGTDGGGISKYNPVTNTFKHFQNDPLNNNSLGVNRVWSILIDRNGVVWAGTYGGGLNRIELKNGKYNFTRYFNKRGDNSSISNNQINTIIEDKEGTIWIATAKGLNKLIKSNNPENYTFEHYFQNPPDSVIFVDNYISNLYLDSQDRFWIGSYSGGLFQFLPEKEEFIKYSPLDLKNSEFKKDIHVLVVFEDGNKNLWLGTESNGIIKFDLEQKKFSKHPKSNSLLSNMIIGMLEDEIGNLWISTSRGLSKYSPRENKINNYTYIDGLESGGFNRNAVLKCEDGRMYFGSNSALTYFYPLEVSNNPYLPKVEITDFKILNKSDWKNNLLTYTKILHEKTPIELTKNDYFFTIEFAALDYTIPTQNQYKYMLEGLDEDWIDASSNRTATYTNLDPGLYTFKVKGSNNDKIWNETPTELVIKVIPPFYKTKGFVILFVLLIILFILLFIKLRTQNLIRDKKLLEEKISKRTNEISQQKEELASQAENLEKTNLKLEFQQERLEKLVYERTADLEIAKEKAEESDRLKSSFLANMSHEIRTPMNAIIGFSNLVEDETMEKVQRKELTKLIRTNSNLLINLIEDIIDISKIESDQLKIKEKKCSVNKIFNELLVDFEDAIQSNNQVSIKVSDEHLNNPLNILSDPYRLSQILKNLISNAIKFTERGIVEFGYEIDSIKSQKQIQFYVKDTGIGISPEQQEQIFSRFTKIEDNKKKMYRGAGLGLTITKNLVELMNGEIKVESEINKGSTFYFKVPYKPVATENNTILQQKKPTSKINWKNKTILIAEDEVSNFKFLEMIIRKTSAEILWAKTGIEVIKLCKLNNNIDLILMDIKMPEMDGLEAVREIRKYNDQVPIIVQSAFSTPEDMTLSFNAGANDFVSKPIGKEKLINMMNNYLGSE